MTHRGPFQPRTFCDSVICMSCTPYKYMSFAILHINKTRSLRFWRMNHCLIYKLAEVLKGVNKLQCAADNVKLLAKAPG